MKRIYVLLVTSFLVFVSYQYISGRPFSAGDLSAQLSQNPLPNAGAEKKQSFDLKNLLGWNKKANSSADSSLKENLTARGPERKNGASSTIPSKKPSLPQVDVEDVNRQLQDIIKLNDALKINQVATAAEIQQIQEQAKIHQQLLQKLETTETAVNRSEVNEVLRQEKIRLIREQTSRNTEIVKTLERQRRP